MSERKTTYALSIVIPSTEEKMKELIILPISWEPREGREVLFRPNREGWIKFPISYVHTQITIEGDVVMGHLMRLDLCSHEEIAMRELLMAIGAKSKGCYGN